jgi:hypothetical protein
LNRVVGRIVLAQDQAGNREEAIDDKRRESVECSSITASGLLDQATLGRWFSRSLRTCHELLHTLQAEPAA